MRKRPVFQSWWRQGQLLGGWVDDVEDDPTLAFCKYCRVTLRACFTSLVNHGECKKHLKAKMNYRDPIIQRPNSNTPSESSEGSRKATTSNLKKSPPGGNAEPCIYIDDNSVEHVEPSISQSPGENVFSGVAVPDMPSEHSVIPCPDEPSEPPASTAFSPSNTQVSNSGAFHNSHNEKPDDLNHLFGLYVAAGLRECSKKQASLARSEIQTILHQATVNAL